MSKAMTRKAWLEYLKKAVDEFDWDAAYQEQGEPVMTVRIWRDKHGDQTAEFRNWHTLPDGEHSLYTTPQPAQKPWVGLTPLNIEDEYVRNYLWERALIAIDDPCCRSHPHENMNEYCQRRTELARYQAKLKEKNSA